MINSVGYDPINEVLMVFYMFAHAQAILSTSVNIRITDLRLPPNRRLRPINYFLFMSPRTSPSAYTNMVNPNE